MVGCANFVEGPLSEGAPIYLCLPTRDEFQAELYHALTPSNTFAQIESASRHKSKGMETSKKPFLQVTGTIATSYP